MERAEDVEGVRDGEKIWRERDRCREREEYVEGVTDGEKVWRERYGARETERGKVREG